MTRLLEVATRHHVRRPPEGQRDLPVERLQLAAKHRLDLTNVRGRTRATPATTTAAARRSTRGRRRRIELRANRREIRALQAATIHVDFRRTSIDLAEYPAPHVAKQLRQRVHLTRVLCQRLGFDETCQSRILQQRRNE